MYSPKLYAFGIDRASAYSWHIWSLTEVHVYAKRRAKEKKTTYMDVFDVTKIRVYPCDHLCL